MLNISAIQNLTKQLKDSNHLERYAERQHWVEILVCKASVDPNDFKHYWVAQCHLHDQPDSTFYSDLFPDHATALQNVSYTMQVLAGTSLEMVHNDGATILYVSRE